jgi:hypothetical protein
MNYCPKRAIETAHSFFFILLIALILFVNPFLSEEVMLFVTRYLHGSGFAYELLYFIVQWLVAIPIYVAGYKLMHYLARYRFFSNLIKYTSFTYWKFWRRYRAPKQLTIEN